MATLLRRLAQLEQRSGGDGGRNTCGVRRIHYLTRTGPPEVRVPQTGETFADEASFRRHYPRGPLVQRMEYGEPTDDDLVPA